MVTTWRSHFSNIRCDIALPSRRHDEQHPLLRFGQHDLVRGHAALTPGHERNVDLYAGSPSGSALHH